MMVLGIIVALIGVLIMLALFACMKVSGECSREEEKRDGK